jgi:hypothetical protein
MTLCKRFGILALAAALVSCGGEAGPLDHDDGDGEDVDNSTDDYGEPGQYEVEFETFANPAWPENGRGETNVTVFFPSEVEEPVPVLFFSHGFGARDRDIYRHLIDHVVSRGSALVYAPYPTTFEGLAINDMHSLRYDALWGGFETAVSRYSERFDLTRVGFLGHSFGGGATPAMAHRGLSVNGWGENGAFVFIMAPWYSFEFGEENTALTDIVLESLPGHTNAVVQAYDVDDVNDHRMAIDLFEHLALPQGQKAYHNVLPHPDYPADHMVPCSDVVSHAFLDELDREAIWRPLDALMDASFNLADPELGTSLSLAPGSLGDYIEVTGSPQPVWAEEEYQFPWSGTGNLRD